MKIAFASRDGIAVDEHFGKATMFQLWEVGPDRAECIGQVSESEGDTEDHIVAKAKALEGCTIAYSLQIGGPAAAKLVARHIHPIKTGHAVPIAETVAKLQEVLRGDPPPWLTKVMGGKPKRQFCENPEE